MSNLETKIEKAQENQGGVYLSNAVAMVNVFNDNKDRIAQLQSQIAELESENHEISYRLSYIW